MACVTWIWKSHSRKYQCKPFRLLPGEKWIQTGQNHIDKGKLNACAYLNSSYSCDNGIHSNNEDLCVLTVVGYDSHINSLSKLLIRTDISIALGGKQCLLGVSDIIKF